MIGFEYISLVKVFLITPKFFKKSEQISLLSALEKTFYLENIFQFYKYKLYSIHS